MRCATPAPTRWCSMAPASASASPPWARRTTSSTRSSKPCSSTTLPWRARRQRSPSGWSCSARPRPRPSRRCSATRTTPSTRRSSGASRWASPCACTGARTRATPSQRSSSTTRTLSCATRLCTRLHSPTPAQAPTPRYAGCCTWPCPTCPTTFAAPPSRPLASCWLPRRRSAPRWSSCSPSRTTRTCATARPSRWASRAPPPGSKRRSS
mmetsp:Transcript_339/g.723  ORF Transcript_339/g.723 Transcript_339/m.723 type:complete len:210 (-) Transcript_339:119-748(-)